ncbi:MAG: fructose-bisphosphatase class II family protein [Methylococcales bacterium]|nr:fructose-bisphosphatase class II family protein [Methylococcales bacterium]
MNEPQKTIHHVRNIGLDLLRVTEATALAAGRWVGSGNYEQAHIDATKAMYNTLNELNINGRIVLGEEGRMDSCLLKSNAPIGTGKGPAMDILADPIDGTRMVVQGMPGAISVVAAATAGSMWNPHPAVYMNKIVVDREVAHALVPEVMDAPVGWLLALVARIKKKSIRDLDVIVLYKRRHEELIDEIRATGARVWLRPAGDVEGALVAATPNTIADVLMGIGGGPEGIISACAVKALGGGMVARLAPQSEAEKEAIIAAGHDLNRIWTVDEMVSSSQIFVAATGITRSWLLSEVDYLGDEAESHSILLRASTGTRRFVHTRQLIENANGGK